VTERLDHIPLIVGTFADYDGLIASLRLRAEALGLSYSTIEALADMADGSLGKYLADLRVKNLSIVSLVAVARALALRGAFIEDQKLLAVMTPLWEKRDDSKAHAKRSARLGPKTMKRVLSEVAAEMGRRGGMSTQRRLTPQQRRTSAQRAAQARWQSAKN
jgi:hypothetical protein